jgi:ribose transport system ATP-binding protein
LIRKWAYSVPKVYILHEPTQGVDVGAKRQVFGELARMSEEGATVLISSVEFEDLVNLCHRVHVVRKGTIERTLEGDALTVKALALAVHER